MDKLRRELMIQRIIIMVMCVVLVVLSFKMFEREKDTKSQGQDLTSMDVSNQQAINKPISTQNDSLEKIEEESDNVDENSVSENIVVAAPKIEWKEDYDCDADFVPLEQRLAIRESYEETVLINNVDKEIIEKNTFDFSNMKIVCVGDSITKGSEGEKSYPQWLQEILGAKEVVNMGIGGSTIADGDRGYEAMVNRVEQIPDDADLIIIMGGTNDAFYQQFWEFGIVEGEAKGEGSFCYGTQLMMRRLKWWYPDTKSIIVVPMVTSKVEEMKKDNPGLVGQESYTNAIHHIAKEESMDIIDLYNANFMNSYDQDIIANFMSDNVHPSEAGAKVLAEHLAAEIIRRVKE